MESPGLRGGLQVCVPIPDLYPACCVILGQSSAFSESSLSPLFVVVFKIVKTIHVHWEQAQEKENWPLASCPGEIE